MIAPFAPSRSIIARRLGRTATESIEREIAVETAVAIEINGLGYAVMMATPCDLIDFAYGFAITERLVTSVEQVLEVEPFAAEAGWLLRLTLAEEAFEPLRDRVRHRIAESGCGLCGIENLEQALKPLPRAAPSAGVDPTVIFAALETLRDHQPLNAATGAVHAAALCDGTGSIMLCREDVGRHNAFDKLIGAARRNGTPLGGGFALLTSRCSYELVEKAVVAGLSMLVTISAPTTLAAERALAAGLTLVALARPDAMIMVTDGAQPQLS